MSKITISRAETNEETSFRKKTGVNFRATQLAASIGSKVRRIIGENSPPVDVTNPEITQELGLDIIANFGLDNVCRMDYNL